MADIWRYTPRQALAFLILADEQRRRDLRDHLFVTAAAVHGGDAFKAILKQLGDDG